MRKNTPVLQSGSRLALGAAMVAAMAAVPAQAAEADEAETPVVVAQAAAQEAVDDVVGHDRVRLVLAKLMEFVAQGRVFIDQNCCRQKRCVFGAGNADGKGGNRDACGHLDDREERIHAAQRAAFDRDAEDGNDGLRSEHAGQVGRTAGAGLRGVTAGLRALGLLRAHRGRARAGPMRRCGVSHDRQECPAELPKGGGAEGGGERGRAAVGDVAVDKDVLHGCADLRL